MCLVRWRTVAAFVKLWPLIHNKLAHVDYRAGLLLGAGGIIGAQIGARLIEHVSTAGFRKIFAVVLVGLSIYLFTRK